MPPPAAELGRGTILRPRSVYYSNAEGQNSLGRNGRKLIVRLFFFQKTGWEEQKGLLLLTYCACPISVISISRILSSSVSKMSVY